MGATANESAALSESQTTGALATAAATEAVSTSDVSTTVLAATAAGQETVSTGDVATAIAAMGAATSESSPAADSVSAGNATAAQVSESTAAGESSTGDIVILVDFDAAVISLADSYVGDVTNVIGITEILSPLDSSAVQAILNGITVESGSLNDVTQAILSMLLTIDETVVLVDQQQVVEPEGEVTTIIRATSAILPAMKIVVTAPVVISVKTDIL
jgi:hypothetical protein